MERINKKDCIASVELSTKSILNLKELALYTGFRPSYIYELTSQKKIPHSKPTGSRLFFERKKIDEWLLSNEVEANCNTG